MGTGTATRKDTARPSPVLPVLAAVVGLLVVVGAALAGPWEAAPRGVNVPYLPAQTEDPLVLEEPAPEMSELTTGDGGVLVAVLVVLGLLLLAVLLRAFLRRVSFARGTSGTPHESVPGTVTAAPDAEIEPDLPALRRGVAAAQSVLTSAADPDDAIIAAWLELEAAAASSGVARAPSDTPTELTTAVLDATRADPAATRTLLRLYHRARFAPQAVLGPDDVTQAARCLARLAESWEQR